MQVRNIQNGLYKTMIAVFKKKGLDDQAATNKAVKNLAAATIKFNEARARSMAAIPNRSDLIRTALTRPTLVVGGGHSTSVSVGVGKPPKVGIRSGTPKVTSAEQVALRKVSGPAGTKPSLATKTSASVAIAYGAVAKWASKL